MKSNIVTLSDNKTYDRAILSEVEKCCLYNGLEKKEALKISLLAEELIGMLPNLVSGYKASFWIENTDKNYELHAVVNAPEMTADEMDKAIAVSSSGKNEAAKGIIGKIRAAINVMCASVENPDLILGHYDYMDGGMSTTRMEMYSCLWSLDNYRNAAKQEKAEAWDELEKSVIAKMADDVTVGIKGRQIDIIVKKAL